MGGGHPRLAGLAIAVVTEVGAAPGSPFPLDGECLDYVIVDVFVGGGRPFAGNPLAVVLGGDRLTSQQCQALAVEFHLSETVFAMTPTMAGADYRARIFTIAAELPFAGHPSVGVAWVLSRRGVLAPGTAIQQCGAGLVTLDLPADADDADGPIRLTGPTPVMSEPGGSRAAAGRRRPNDR